MSTQINPIDKGGNRMYLKYFVQGYQPLPVLTDISLQPNSLLQLRNQSAIYKVDHSLNKRTSNAVAYQHSKIFALPRRSPNMSVQFSSIWCSFWGNFSQIIGCPPPLWGSWPPLGNPGSSPLISFLCNFIFHFKLAHSSIFFIFSSDLESVPNRLKPLQYLRVNNIRAAAFLEFSAQRNSRCHLNDILSGRGAWLIFIIYWWCALLRTYTSIIVIIPLRFRTWNTQL